MTTYQVTKVDTMFHVVGLKDSLGTEPEHGTFAPEGDVVLLCVYPEGDCDVPYDTTTMHGALYDLFQVRDDLKDGDRFETPFGNFECVGVHVVRR